MSNGKKQATCFVIINCAIGTFLCEQKEKSAIKQWAAQIASIFFGISIFIELIGTFENLSSGRPNCLFITPL